MGWLLRVNRVELVNLREYQRKGRNLSFPFKTRCVLSKTPAVKLKAVHFIHKLLTRCVRLSQERALISLYCTAL